MCFILFSPLFSQGNLPGIIDFPYSRLKKIDLMIYKLHTLLDFVQSWRLQRLVQRPIAYSRRTNTIRTKM